MTAASNPFNPGYYDEHELRGFGFASVGDHVRVARNCVILGLDRIKLGSHVRIDGFTTLSAGGGFLHVGSHVHISAAVFLVAGDGITLEDFCGVSHGVRIYSRNDDYSGEALTGPTVPAHLTKVNRAAVRVGRHAILGAGSTLLPGTEVGEGVALGAMSLARGDLTPWTVWAGVPARPLKSRARTLLDLEHLADGPISGI